MLVIQCPFCEELIRLKLALGAKMKEGLFGIASARYSLGGSVGRIGRLQYDNNMEAQTILLVRHVWDEEAGIRQLEEEERAVMLDGDESGRAKQTVPAGR